MEQGNGSPRVDTLMRFCEVMKVELSYLLAHDVIITEESLEKYGMKTFGFLTLEHERMEQKVEFFNYIMKNNLQTAPVENNVNFPVGLNNDLGKKQYAQG
jgi:transcriptional regulator with XRE-family HTH domain